MNFCAEDRIRSLILTVCSTIVVLTLFGRTLGFFEKEKGTAIPAAMATHETETRT